MLTADGRRAIKAGRFTKDADGHHLTGDNRIDHGVRASFNAGKEGVAARKTVGWRRCGCEPEPGGSAPCLVLDPFGGAGTVGLVAQRLGRDALLLELNPKYAAMAETRIKADATRKARKAKAAPKPDKRQGVLV